MTQAMAKSLKIFMLNSSLTMETYLAGKGSQSAQRPVSHAGRKDGRQRGCSKHSWDCRMLVTPGRLELPAYGLGNRRSILLSYGVAGRLLPHFVPQHQSAGVRSAPIKLPA